MAALYLSYMGLMLTACTALHSAAQRCTELHGALIFAWTHIKWTASRPVPDFLQFPAAELLLLILLALPAAMYSMLLMVQAPMPAQRVLGVAVFFFAVLGYLLLISWLLQQLFIVRHKRALGLCVPANSNAGSSIGGSSVFGSSRHMVWSPFAALGQLVGSKRSRRTDEPGSATSSSRQPTLVDSAMPLTAMNSVNAPSNLGYSTSASSNMHQGSDLCVLAAGTVHGVPAANPAGSQDSTAGSAKSDYVAAQQQQPAASTWPGRLW